MYDVWDCVGDFIILESVDKVKANQYCEYMGGNVHGYYVFLHTQDKTGQICLF